MILQWGNYNFGLNSAEVMIDRSDQLDEAQNAWAYEERWKVRVFLDNPTASAVTMAANLARLEQAFSSNGKDLKLLLANGTPSHHVLLNSQTIGGTRITKRPSYPEGKGYQYGTFRTVDFEVAALVPVSNRSSLTSFIETLSTEGGGPRYGHLEPLTGSPIKQLLKRNTIWRAVQQGSAVGRDGWPQPPAPLWPDALVDPQGFGIQKQSPSRIGDSWVNYQVSWTYLFEAASRRIGNPNFWSN